MSDHGESEASTKGDFLRNRSDDFISSHLIEFRGRAREIMHEFNIPMGHVCEMARLSEERISDTALRAEFLRILIDVHEFGREAKRRGVPVTEKSGAGDTSGTKSAQRSETSLFAPTIGASDTVSDSASRDFFDALRPQARPGRSDR